MLLSLHNKYYNSRIYQNIHDAATPEAAPAKPPQKVAKKYIPTVRNIKRMKPIHILTLNLSPHV